MSTNVARDVMLGRDAGPAESRTAALFGVESAAIRWEHGLLVFAALYAEGMCKFALNRWLYGSGTLGWEILRSFMLEQLCTEAALALLAVLCYRFLRRPAIAIPVAAAGYALAHAAVVAADALLVQRGAHLALGEVLVPPALSGFIFAALMLSILELALRRMRHLPAAFLLASIGSSLGGLLVGALVIYPLFFGAEMQFAGVLRRLPVTLIGSAVFALVWWGGLALASAAPFFRPVSTAALSRSFYAGSLYSLFGVSMITLIAVVLLSLTGNWRFDAVSATLLIVTGLMVIAGAVILMRFVYRMWAALRGKGARTTPGKAVGLLFVPIFNVYWGFQVFPGFATDFNRVAAARGVTARLPWGLYLAYPIVVWLALVPVAGVFLTPVSLAILLAIVAKGADAASALAAAPVKVGAA